MSTKRTLMSVGIRAGSFCSPSRGPTSMMRTWFGRAVVVAMLATLLLVAKLQEDCARGDLLADLDTERLDDARVGRFDHVLHLHRFEHQQRLVWPNVLARLDADLDDATRHGRGQAAGASGDAAVGGGV